MNGGYVQQLGTPKEIYDTPANLFVATFMGSPSMNLLDVTVRVEADAVYAVTQNDKGAEIKLAFFEPSEQLRSFDGRNVIMGVRPEALTDPEGADHRSTHVERVLNTVIVTEPAGSDTFVTTTIGGAECVGRMRSDAEVSPGQEAEFAINMEKAVAFDPKTEMRIV